MQVGPCILVGTRLEEAGAGPTSGPARRPFSLRARAPRLQQQLPRAGEREDRGGEPRVRLEAGRVAVATRTARSNAPVVRGTGYDVRQGSVALSLQKPGAPNSLADRV